MGCILNGMAVNLFSILASDKHYIYFKIDLKMFCDRKSGSTLRVTGHEVGTFRHLQLGIHLMSEYHASDPNGRLVRQKMADSWDIYY